MIIRVLLLVSLYYMMLQVTGYMCGILWRHTLSASTGQLVSKTRSLELQRSNSVCLRNLRDLRERTKSTVCGLLTRVSSLKCFNKLLIVRRSNLFSIGDHVTYQESIGVCAHEVNIVIWLSNLQEDDLQRDTQA